MKTCSKCGAQKLEALFPRRDSVCKECVKARGAAYRATHRDESYSRHYFWTHGVKPPRDLFKIKIAQLRLLRAVKSKKEEVNG